MSNDVTFTLHYLTRSFLFTPSIIKELEQSDGDRVHAVKAIRRIFNISGLRMAVDILNYLAFNGYLPSDFKPIFETGSEICNLPIRIEEHQQNYSFLADLIDDLNPQQLTALLNYLAITVTSTNFRANIKAWRKANNLKV